MAVRKGAAAIGWAKSPLPRHGLGGLCLKYTRQAHNAPPKYGYARLAWQKAKKRHKTSSWKQIPAGVPIFMDKPGSKYGHVALYAGGGKMYTTRASTNRTHLDPVDLWISWGWRLLGWTEDLNGVVVYTKPKETGAGVKVDKYRVTPRQGVNMRVKPSTTARVVRTLARGKLVNIPKGAGTVTGSGRRWYRTAGGSYVAADFLEKVS